jgi:hypothetical protein
MMMVGVFARHVKMASPAVRIPVDALHDTQAGKQIERPKHSRTPNPRSLLLQRFPQVRRREGAFAAYYFFKNLASRPGQAVALVIEAVKYCIDFGHNSTLQIIRRMRVLKGASLSW